jgi:hypothetical protein
VTEGRKGVVLALIVVGAALLGIWDSLYTLAMVDTAIMPSLPFLCALTVSATAVTVRSTQSRRTERVAASLLALVPLISVEILGYCIKGGFLPGLEMVLIFGGPGILLGLLLTGSDRPNAAPEARAG